jgi:ankyrin repeat protein
LHFAAWKGNLSLIELLLKEGAEVDAVTFLNGETPLHYAARMVIFYRIKLSDQRVNMELRSSS